jgi:hypothetical protein
MEAWEKHPIQHVVEAAFWARIGAIEGKLPLLPTKPDHGAPFLHYCVFFGHEHWKFSIHMTAAINASAGSPPKPANALGGVRSDKPPPKPVFCGTKVLPALKRSN